ncbi:hypothetical protein Tco_1251600, partial [Tanacetum coccineum]
CISGKTTRLDRLRESQAQILWGMYNKKDLDYVALLWEDFMYQDDNKEISSVRKEHMPYPRFTKVIISHFISKDKTIFIRNMINLHTIRDDLLLGTLKFVSKTQDYQQHGALIHDDMMNQDIKDSKAYKTYYDFATGKVPPKKARKYNKVVSPQKIISYLRRRTCFVIRDTPGVPISKKKAPAKGGKGKGDRVGSQPKVLDESQDKTTSTDKGISTKPGVSDVHKYFSKSENESWGDSGNDDNDDDSNEVTKDDDNEDDVECDANDDKEASNSEKKDSNKDENLNLNQNDDEEEEKEEEYVRTPDSFEFNDDDEEYDELYKDVNVRSKVVEHEKVGKGDAEMTDTTHESASQENDLEYLKGGSFSSKYTTSTTKTKAAKYDTTKGIENMVTSLWSLVKVAYHKYVMWGISYWGPKRQHFYGYASNRKSKHDVGDQSLHKFVEGDFPRLNLHDIEDMLLLLVQKKLSNLERDDLFDLNVALQMFTRRVVILKRVEDLQLGVKSYQKKLNLTRPKTFRSDISKMTPCTAYNNSQGIMYQDKFRRNRLMRFDELYKFCDGTISSIQRVLHDIASSL